MKIPGTNTIKLLFYRQSTCKYDISLNEYITKQEHQNGEKTETGKENKHEENEQSEIQPPTIERRMSEDPHFELQGPEQVAIAAASHFIKQLRMFTDANVTSKMVDDVFKLFVVGVPFNTHSC